MAKPNWVKLASGRSAVPFRIEFLLEFEEMVSALAYSVRNEAYLGELPTLTSSQVDQRIRASLREAGGENYGYWSDEMGPVKAVKIEEWARELVTKAYGYAEA